MQIPKDLVAAELARRTSAYRATVVDEAGTSYGTDTADIPFAPVTGQFGQALGLPSPFGIVFEGPSVQIDENGLWRDAGPNPYLQGQLDKDCGVIVRMGETVEQALARYGGSVDIVQALKTEEEELEAGLAAVEASLAKGKKKTKPATQTVNAPAPAPIAVQKRIRVQLSLPGLEPIECSAWSEHFENGVLSLVLKEGEPFVFPSPRTELSIQTPGFVGRVYSMGMKIPVEIAGTKFFVLLLADANALT